jgi:phosphoribosylformimino-5-aminoimidazole carboxamide ribotide isomerase
MLTIIPAIDIIGGKCVRLEQGDFSSAKAYSSDPLGMAKSFEDAGVKRLHIVDLDGARTGSPVNLFVLERIASATSLEIDFGGGIKTEESLLSVLDAGASMVSIGSLAVKAPDIFYGWVKKYGAEKIFLGADVKNGKVAVSGWLEDSGLELFAYLESNCDKGVRNVFVTDISKDGMLQGPAVDLYKEILKRIPGIVLTASGGVSCVDDIIDLERCGLNGVILGKAIYEGKISLADLKPWLC